MPRLFDVERVLLQSLRIIMLVERVDQPAVVITVLFKVEANIVSINITIVIEVHVTFIEVVASAVPPFRQCLKDQGVYTTLVSSIARH